MNKILPAGKKMEESEAMKTFSRLKEETLKQPEISFNQRVEILKSIERILSENDEAICAAISQDFGNRSYHETRILEITPTILGIRYTLKRLKKWMKPQKRHVSKLFIGGKNTVIPQAKGVVGIVSPWNYPLQLALSPMTSAIAAGNRVMLKMAAHSQNICRLLQRLFSTKIPEELITIMPGVKASEFSQVPFDHLLFTGSPQVGRTIMRMASEHLTPVTLELGGKSPTIIGEDINIGLAAARIMYSKLTNEGQMCVAPDYLFIPESKFDSFVAEAKRIVTLRYPSLASKDYTCIIDDKAYQRLIDTLEDAKQKHAEVIKLIDDQDHDQSLRKIAPMIIKNVTEEMIILQDEIFGPFLPVKTYRNLEEVIGYINRRERPLALYIYSNNRKFQDQILRNTISGGVTINDCAMHVAQHDMPFGGIGNSGLGCYHGYEGFVELSKMKPVFRQSRFAIAIAPPYGKTVDRIYGMVKKFHWIN